MRGDEHDCDLWSGGKHLEDTPEILTYCVIFSHIARHGVEVWDLNNEEEVSKGEGLSPISWEVSLVFMECSQYKNVVGVEGCFVGTPECEWIHNCRGVINWFPWY